MSALPSWINIEKTIKMFGYNPKYLFDNSHKKVMVICPLCNKERIVRKQAVMIHPLCYKCGHQTDEYKQKRRKLLQNQILNNGHPRLGKKHNIESKQKMSVAKQGIFDGKNNPMYGKEPAKYSKVNKGGWYSRKDGRRIYLRSSWEFQVAKYLDTNNFLWEYELNAFPIKYNDKEGTYRPDFYLINEKEYWEVKGWWRGDALSKYIAFLKQYPKIKIKIIDKIKLNELNDISIPVRRRLHDTQFSKGHIRYPYSHGNFKGIGKGTICEFGQIVGGTKDNVWIRNSENKRIGKSIKKIGWLSKRFKIKGVAIHPPIKIGGFLATML
jgi:hypothetical protein